MYNVDTDYRLVDYNSDLLAVSLMIPPYDDVVYHYGGVRFDPEGEIGVLSFNYNIISPGKHDIEDLIVDTNFHNIIGDILSDILVNQERFNGEIRTNNTEESDLQ